MEWPKTTTGLGIEYVKNELRTAYAHLEMAANVLHDIRKAAIIADPNLLVSEQLEVLSECIGLIMGAKTNLWRLPILEEGGTSNL